MNNGKGDNQLKYILKHLLCLHAISIHSDKTMISQYTVQDKMEFKILKIEAFINSDGFPAIKSNSDGDTSITLPTMEKPAVYDEEQVKAFADTFAQTV